MLYSQKIPLRHNHTKIRRETEKDYRHIYDVVKEAFSGAEHSDGTEQDLVEDLRRGTSYIPELSLVAEIHGEIVGFIMFTKLIISGTVQLALAPLAVKPQFQSQGVGSALIEKGHEIAKALGYQYCVVLGIKGYYPKFGYAPADKYGILPPFEVERDSFMAIQLIDAAKPLAGIVEYASEFGI